MAEKPYKPLVYALPASSPIVTQPQPPHPGSEAVFAIHGSTAITIILLVVCTNTVSVNPSTGLATQVIAIEQQDREQDCRMWAKSEDPDPVRS